MPMLQLSLGSRNTVGAVVDQFECLIVDWKNWVGCWSWPSGGLVVVSVLMFTPSALGSSP